MKITTIILLIGAMQIQAATFAQQLTFQSKNVQISRVFDEVKKQTGYDVFYLSKVLNTDKRIDADFKEASLAEVMERVLAGSQLAYTIDDKTIVIKETKTPNTTVQTQAQTSFTGIVRDSNGEPLVGASVRVKDGTRSTTTNAKGEFTITLNATTAVLQISHIGYDMREVTVKAGSHASVVLPLLEREIEDVVVIGYGEIERAEVTGAISSIKVEDEAKERPVVAASDLIQGRVAGVQIVNNSGVPGSEITFNIRGVSSFGNHEPLIVIDGVPVEAGTYGGSASLGDISQAAIAPYIRNNGLANINPNDIASIEILKDAAATSIYGSRASNGVVLITTKSGIPGTSKVEYNFNMTNTKIRKLYDLLDSRTYMEYYNEGYVNDGRDSLYPINDDYEFRATNTSDWQSLIFQEAVSQDHQVALSGGDNKSQYSITGNYADSKGIAITSRLKRYSGRISYVRDVTDKLKVTVNAAYSDTKQDAVPQGVSASGNSAQLSLISSALGFEPFNRAYTPQGDFEDDVNNPLALIHNRADIYGAKLLTSRLNAAYKITNDLTFRLNTAFNSRRNLRDTYFGRSTVMGRQAPNGFGILFDDATDSHLAEYTLNYIKPLNKRSRLNAFVGYTYQEWNRSYKRLSGSDFPSDATLYYNLGLAGTVQKPSTSTQKSALASFVGRAIYTYGGKYVFAATGRYDGSTRLSPQNRWSFFPSLSASWNMEREKFLRNTLLSQAKLRASWGLTGNQSVGIGSSQAVFSSSTAVFGNRLPVGYIPGSFENPYLTWETNEQWNIGVDLGVKKNRYTLSANYYVKNVRDQIGAFPLPADVGFGSYTANMGAIKNYGVELEASAAIIEKKEVTWDVSGNISFNRNKVLSLGDVDERLSTRTYMTGMSLHTTRVGGPMYMFQGYLVDGVYQNQAEVDAGPVDATVPNQPGSLKFVDSNGDGKINTADMIELGSPFPDYLFGLTNTVGYKDFQLSVFINGSIGNKIANMTKFRLSGLVATNRWNALQEAYDNRWTGEGTSNYYPRVASNSREPYNGRFTNLLLEDGSFVRLKNVTLSYNLPLAKFRIKHINGFKVFATGTNLLTITDYTGYDPEVSGASSNSPGVDFFTAPTGRMFTFGFNVLL